MVECLAHGHTAGKWWSQVSIPSTELQLALQWDLRDWWDFKRPGVGKIAFWAEGTAETKFE